MHNHCHSFIFYKRWLILNESNRFSKLKCTELPEASIPGPPVLGPSISYKLNLELKNSAMTKCMEKPSESQLGLSTCLYSKWILTCSTSLKKTFFSDHAFLYWNFNPKATHWVNKTLPMSRDTIVHNQFFVFSCARSFRLAKTSCDLIVGHNY